MLLGSRPPPIVLVGDFNAQPTDPAITSITARMHLVYDRVHPHAPERTTPPLLTQRDNVPGRVIDFIFANDRIDVHDAWRTFEQPDDDDETLTASDHFGLAAEINLRST